MPLPSPRRPPYDVRDWQRRPFAERLRMVCQCWAIHGYGTPWPVYLFYLLKVGLYLAAWCLFCSFSVGAPGIGHPAQLPSWWSAPDAFAKAVLWSMAFEGLGLGCASGPLTGRYYPPIAGVLHFARPGTTKLPLVPGLPIIGGDRRTLLDVALYLLHYAFLLRALVSPEVTPALLVPTAILLPLLGLTDKTLFLAARAEHYYAVLVCLLFPADALAGAKVVWVAIWWWAATSKLNRHFPSVVAVMQSNSPLTNFGNLRQRLFRHFPDDLRPAPIVHWMAHAGTLTEYLFPALLLVGDGGATTTIGLVVMVLFHAFITSSVPMGVPIEWNFLMVYGGLLLFGHHAGVSPLAISSPLLIGYLAAAVFIVPLLGNLVPSAVSFLCSMRYYAGNWAYSIWLFRGDSTRKLDQRLVKAAPHVRDQLLRFYDEEVTVAALSKVMAFRAMHLHGRALQLLLPKVVEGGAGLDECEYVDGELVAGLALGWNFGDGHLHGPELLGALQRQCHFEVGELRCLFVESQPVGKSTMAWTIADAATGIRSRGTVEVGELLELQPWPRPRDDSNPAPDAIRGRTGSSPA